MAISGLDDVDNRIIELLRQNARLSYSDIGKAVRKSRVAVKTRIEQLEKNGIIIALEEPGGTNVRKKNKNGMGSTMASARLGHI